MATISQTQHATQSQAVLANAVEILVGVVMEIAGNDIASTINGSSVSRSTIAAIALPIMKRELESN